MKTYMTPFSETVTVTEDPVNASNLTPGENEGDIIPWFMGGNN